MQTHPDIPASSKERVDTRVLEYAARAPMTYPVAFDLLPVWPPPRATTRREGINPS